MKLFLYNFYCFKIPSIALLIINKEEFKYRFNENWISSQIYHFHFPVLVLFIAVILDVCISYKLFYILEILKDMALLRKHEGRFIQKSLLIFIELTIIDWIGVGILSGSSVGYSDERSVSKRHLKGRKGFKFLFLYLEVKNELNY